MLMILARLGRSESFWAVAKVRSPHTGPGIRYIIARLRPGARAPVLRRLLPCASRRAPSGARPAAMPAAYTDDLAWRVVMRVHFFRQDVATVCDSRLGWACRGTT